MFLACHSGASVIGVTSTEKREARAPATAAPKKKQNKREMDAADDGNCASGDWRHSVRLPEINDFSFLETMVATGKLTEILKRFSNSRVFFLLVGKKGFEKGFQKKLPTRPMSHYPDICGLGFAPTQNPKQLAQNAGHFFL